MFSAKSDSDRKTVESFPRSPLGSCLWFDRRLPGTAPFLSLSAGVIIIIATPILVLNWPAIHDYYVIGHVVSNEKYISAAMLGIIRGRFFVLKMSKLQEMWVERGSSLFYD